MSTNKIATYEQVILSALSQREIDGLAFAKAVFGLEEASKAVDDYDAARFLVLKENLLAEVAIAQSLLGLLIIQQGLQPAF